MSIIVSMCGSSKKWPAPSTTSWVMVMPFCSCSLLTSVTVSAGGATRSAEPLMTRPEDGQGARNEKSYMFAGGETETKPGDLGPPHQELHPDPGAEREARDPAVLGVGVHRLQVVERRGGVRQLADALVVLALAAADAAEVEPQHGEAEAVEGVVQVVDDAVVHRAAELRVRMQHDGDGGVAVPLRMVAAFEPALGAGEDDFGHEVPCPGPAAGFLDRNPLAT